MLDEIGIDMIPGPAGVAPIFKFGGNSLTGWVAKFFGWLAAKIIPKVGTDIATLVAKAVDDAVQGAVSGAVDVKTFTGAGKFLEKAGASDVWMKAVKNVTGPGASIVKNGYRAAWAQAYKDLANNAGKKGFFVVKEAKNVDKRKKGTKDVLADPKAALMKLSQAKVEHS